VAFGNVRFLQLRAYVQAHRRDQQAEQERQAPAPAFERSLRQCRIKRRAGERAQQRRHALARELPAHAEAPALHAAGLHQHRGGRAHFTAERKALQQPARHDHQRAEHAGRRIAGRQRDAQRAEHHEADGQRHRGLAALAVGVVADDHAAQRAHHEADAEGGHRQQQRAVGAVGGEEQLADQQREEAVDGEVVHLQRIAQRAGGDQAELALLSLALRRGGW
jgi:hypothetical protein